MEEQKKKDKEAVVESLDEKVPDIPDVNFTVNNKPLEPKKTEVKKEEQGTIPMGPMCESIDNMITLMSREVLKKNVETEKIKETQFSKNLVICVNHYFKVPVNSPAAALIFSTVVLTVVILGSPSLKKEIKKVPEERSLREKQEGEDL